MKWLPFVDKNGMNTEIAFADNGRIIARHTAQTQGMFDLIDDNKAFQNSGQTGYTQDKSIKHVARIPAWVALKWMVEDGIDVHNPDHGPRVARKLNDGEWQYLRTGGGRLGVSNGVMR